MIALLLVVQLAATQPANIAQAPPAPDPVAGLIRLRPRAQACAVTAQLQQAEPAAAGGIDPQRRARNWLTPLGKLPPASMCLLDVSKAQVQ